ncbi:Ger(x)C family spore germination protein [Thalassobacillus pellis]|uniref:Ger(x)C family spore germination protein n=1 Tax=Thalassobacillus pellis TaxID=748008 RepID=UPI00196060C5|nr:Ger(x)C family spore germination protein [Thalassobacillus pellis]MBM7551239.1 spore germination protein [Thalassobacillus pellis]
MKKIALLTIATLLFLTSCVMQTEIVDDIALVTAAGFDEGNGDKLLATLSVPFYRSNTDVTNNIYQTKAYFTKDAIDLGSGKSERPMVIGQSEVAIFSKALAEKGLMEYLDTYQRDPSISTRLFVGLAKDKSASLFRGETSLPKDNGALIRGMLKHNIERNFLPKTNLHVFLFDYYQKGKDPFLPIIAKEQGLFTLDGLGFFKKSIYKGSIDYGYDTMVFRQLKESFSHGSYTIKISDKKIASLQNISSRKKVKVDFGKSKPVINFNIRMEGYMREYSGNTINKKVIQSITSHMEKQFQKTSADLLTKFEEWEVDPLGLGNEIRKYKRDWKEHEWRNIYDKVDIQVTIHITIKETGVIA